MSIKSYGLIVFLRFSMFCRLPGQSVIEGTIVYLETI